MKIIIDAAGGDYAPLEVLKGAAEAAKEYGAQIALVGNEAEIRKASEKNGVPLTGLEIIHADRGFPMEADPTSVIKENIVTSMGVGLKKLADGECDAFVSAGSTGALLAGATFLVKRVKGVKRPVIGTTVPNGIGRYYFLVDSGANSECRPEMLMQFAVMGEVYASRIMGIESPRIGLVNIGSEDTKGTQLQLDAFALLKKSGLRFVGNVEARELPLGGCDVAVCDGFTGNVILKLSEGMALFFIKELKRMFLSGAGTKVAAMLMKGQLSEFKKACDYKELGGAPILGVQKPVIKAHGSSDAKAFKNAIRQAVVCCEKDIIGEIARGVAEQKAGAAEKGRPPRK